MRSSSGRRRGRPPRGWCADGLDEVLAQRAADAAVGELEEAVLAAHEVALLGDEGGVDVDFGEVVDDHRGSFVTAVIEHLVEEHGLAGSEGSGEDGDGGGCGHAGPSSGVQGD